MSRKAEITIRARNIPTFEKVMRKLSWRDSWVDQNGHRHEILYEDEGGDMKFVYQNGRMVPYIVDVFVPSKMNTFKKIREYVDRIDFPHEVIDEIPNREITISIDENETGDQFNELIGSLGIAIQRAKFCNHEINIK